MGDRWYTVSDGTSEDRIRAGSHEAAAADWLVEAGWPDEECSSTWWCHVTTRPAHGAAARDPSQVVHHRLRVDPEEPLCDAGGGAHDWAHVETWGCGAGVRVTHACGRCGQRRVTETAEPPAEDPSGC